MRPLLMSRDQMLFVLFLLLPRLSFLLQLNPAVFIGFCTEKERTYLWVECSQALKKVKVTLLYLVAVNKQSRRIYQNWLFSQAEFLCKNTNAEACSFTSICQAGISVTPVKFASVSSLTCQSSGRLDERTRKHWTVAAWCHATLKRPAPNHIIRSNIRLSAKCQFIT